MFNEYLRTERGQKISELKLFSNVELDTISHALERAADWRMLEARNIELSSGPIDWSNVQLIKDDAKRIRILALDFLA